MELRYATTAQFVEASVPVLPLPPKILVSVLPEEILSVAPPSLNKSNVACGAVMED
jgi:hypothetical protein